MDPVSHAVLGSRPTWTGMIAAGSLEAFAATYASQSMRYSPHKFVRRCAPLVPLLLTSIHLIEGGHNLFLKNNFYCANPAYVLTTDHHCVMPPPLPAINIAPPVLTGNRARMSLQHWK